jgi:hypothetical protein
VNYAPISIALDGMGLNVTAFSYAGNMWLCAVSCREMLPDPSFFADCMRNAFELMKEAAAREAAFTVAETTALAPDADGQVIEGKVARKPTSKRGSRRVPAKAPPRAAKARSAQTRSAKAKGKTPGQPAGAKRRARKTAAPDQPA